MSDRDEDLPPAGFASPPCYMHELDPAYGGLVSEPDAQQRADVARWRKAERRRLIAARLAMDGAARRRFSESIAQRLNAVLGDLAGLTVSACWPFRGEPDLRRFLADAARAGARTALPLVVERGRPLLFRSWQPGEALRPGVWNIPEPAGGEAVVPDVVIAPVVGFDAACYRLGYGGGFFDRTLAALRAEPRTIGVGYACQRIATIYPQPHDIPMHLVVTEAGVVRSTGTAA
jgi:5-formyltetrahydrofolate cyclo-ligase